VDLRSLARLIGFLGQRGLSQERMQDLSVMKVALGIRDVVLTADEIRGLTAGLLVSHQPAPRASLVPRMAKRERLDTRPGIRE
jgi:hypothetical protein